MHEGATVHALVSRQAAQRPASIYARNADGSQSLTFAALARSCAQVNGLLRAQGLLAGDTVSLVMPNGLMTLQLLLGAMAGGWVVNPVNLLSQPEQMRYVLGHSDCKLVIVSPEWEQAVRAMVAAIGRSIAVLVLDPDADTLPDAAAGGRAGEDDKHCLLEAAAPEIAPLDADALALLMYTSGTTGVPKGVMLRQRNLVANALAISAAHGLTSEDRVLAVLPLYHINAFAVTMLAPLAQGGSLVMPPKFSAARFWQQALESQCTWLNVVPTMIS